MKKIVFFFAVIGMMIVNNANAQCDSNLQVRSSEWLLCHDDSIKFTSPTGDIWTNSSFTSYHWVYSVEGSEDVILSSNTNVAWISKPKEGTVSLTVNLSKGGCMYGSTSLVDMAPVVQLKSNDVLVKNHDTVTFKNSDSYIASTSGNVNCLTTYTWYDINTKKVESNNPNAFGFTGSTYVLSVMNNDNRPCATFSDTVTILMISKPTGLSIVEIEEILVYPNPFIDFINLDNIKKEATARVIDVSGNEIFSQRVIGNAKIDSSNWAPGFYTLIVGDSTKKIIKY